MPCTKFKDYGKKAGDVLGDDYYQYDRTLEVKVKTSNGVSFTVEGSIDNKDSISASAKAGFKPVDGINVKKFQLTTCGKIVGEASLTDVAEGLTFTVKAEEGHDPQKNKGNLCIDYATGAFTTNFDIDVINGPSVTSYGSVGYESFTFGGMAKYNTGIDPGQTAGVNDFSAGVQYDGGDFHASVVSAKKLSTAKANFYQKKGDVLLGASLTTKLADAKSTKMEVGGVWAKDSDTDVAAKIDSSGILSLGYNQSLSAGVTLGTSVQLNAAKFNGDSQNFGLSLSFE
jgi:voltage-dependent anion channel protein 2